jgi:hypothetical protein
MTLFLYPVDQAVARSTRRVHRTSRPAVAVAVLELIVLVAVVAVAAAISLFSVNFLVLTNSVLGSEMPEGSLVITQKVDAAEISSGDIVSLAPVAAEGYLTGRVIDVSLAAEGASKVTMAVDAEGLKIAEREVAAAQRVLVTLPGLGHVVTSSAQPVAIGFVLLIALGLVLQVVPQRQRRGVHHVRAAHRSFSGHASHAA